MYRQYEDPYKLQDQLKQAKDELAERRNNGEDEESLFSLLEDIEELRQRINFAWQDIEYDENYC